MTCNKTITANFDLITYHLTVNISPSAGGEVMVDSPQPAQGYVVGTEVTLTATASEGYEFNHWSGTVSGSENPTTIMMDSGKKLTANFTEVSSTLFDWWWIVAGVIAIGLLTYLLATRRQKFQ